MQSLLRANENGPMTDAVPPRRFNLGDGMILVATLAVSLAVLRWMALATSSELWPVEGLQWSLGNWIAFFRSDPSVFLMYAVYGGMAVLVLLAVAFLAFASIRLRRPGPPLRETLLQPGMVAFEAVTLCVAIAMLSELTEFDAGHPPLLLAVCAVVVPAAWVALRVTRRWRPERTWIDRFGRVLGVLWIVTSWGYLVVHGVLIGGQF